MATKAKFIDRCLARAALHAIYCVVQSSLRVRPHATASASAASVYASTAAYAMACVKLGLPAQMLESIDAAERDLVSVASEFN